uniref:Putative secreted peptide n=1 Tax=Anopheles braziliensis TaxID=58242 RepID=A0A2M3ZUC8_9DIPT
MFGCVWIWEFPTCHFRLFYWQTSAHTVNHPSASVENTISAGEFGNAQFVFRRSEHCFAPREEMKRKNEKKNKEIPVRW